GENPHRPRIPGRLNQASQYGEPLPDVRAKPADAQRRLATIQPAGLPIHRNEARLALRDPSEDTPAYPLRRSLVKTRTLTILAFSLLGIPILARAQEGPPMPKPETLPPPKEAALPEAPCGTRILWMEYTVPVLTIHAPKEDFVRTEKISTYEI